MTCARPGCANTIEQAATGRPREYCSERCKPGRRKVPNGLTAAELARRTEPVAREKGARPLNGDLLDPLITAGLVERHGRTWVLKSDPAIRAAFGTDHDRMLPLEKDDLPMPKRGPARGTPRPRTRGS